MPPLPIILAVGLVLLPVAAACLLLVFGTTARSGVPRWVALGSTVGALILAGTMANIYYHDVIKANAQALSAAETAEKPINPRVGMIASIDTREA